MPEGDTVHRTADRLDAALRDAVLERAELRWPSVPDVDLAGSRTLEVVARGKHLLHRFDTGHHPAHAPADGGPVAGRAPGPRHRAGAAPPRPAGRRAHRAVVGPRPAPRHARPRADRTRVRRSSATSAPTCSAPTGMPRSRPSARHGIRGADRRHPARPAGARGGRHLLGQRDPLHRARAAVDPCRRPRPRAGARHARAAAPADGRRSSHRLAGEHRHPAVRRGGLRARAVRAAVPALRRHGAGGDDRRGAAPAHDVLVPRPARAGWPRPTTAGHSDRWAAASGGTERRR